MNAPRQLRALHTREHRLLLRHLRELRKQTGKTQADVAAGLGLSRPQYTCLESGYSMLSLDQLVGLAKVYRRSLWRLLEGVI